jgi:hypothetical protein
VVVAGLGARPPHGVPIPIRG